MNVQPTKDTVYIDAEDEITAIIEKVRASDAKIVALVLPKRATTLQSIVNLKLLKRSAKEAKKSLVLITSEAGLLPIAGAVGLHVAKTLQSKPTVPSSPKTSAAAITVDDEAGEPAPDPHASIGQLAGHIATEETIDLNNDDATAAVATKGAKNKLAKKFKIPDFNRFRVMLFGGIALLILLIVGSVFAFVILPKAKIVVKTDTSNVNTDLLITAKTDAPAVDEAAMIVPATSKTLKKTDTEKAAATGQRDDGKKATGKMTLTNCINDGQPHTIPSGTSFSSGGLSFVTTSDVTLATSVYSGSNCRTDLGTSLGFTKDVDVAAGQGGDKYNLSARSYTSPIANISASGSAMTGGTSNLVKVASQTDIDGAKQKITDRLNLAAKDELNAQFAAENFVAITDTLAGGAPTVLSTPNVNEPGAEVNVSVAITFTELGVKHDDLKQLVEADVKKHIDNSKQVIQDNGISKATILTTEKKSANEVKFNIKTLAIAGPQLDEEGIKKQVAGKKKTETEKLIRERPGIKDVTISYSPFWVFSTPKNIKHITVTFDQNNAGQ